MNIRQVTIIEQARSRVVALPNPGPVRMYRLDEGPGEPPSPDAVIEPVTLQPERVAGQEFVVHPDVDIRVQAIIEGLLAERDDLRNKTRWAVEQVRGMDRFAARADRARKFWMIAALTTTATTLFVLTLWWLL